MERMTETYTLAELPITVETLKRHIDTLAQTAVGAVIVALEGDLGAGKTALVKELARQYGVVDVVTSPTFVVMRLYETADTSITTLVHIDAYRIEDEQEIEVLNIKALLDTPQTLVCIEWPQQIPEILSTRSRFVVQLSTIDDDVRSIEINYTTA